MSQKQKNFLLYKTFVFGTWFFCLAALQIKPAEAKKSFHILAPKSFYKSSEAAKPVTEDILRKILQQAGYQSTSDFSKVIQGENYLGSGSLARVYSIPGMDDYVLKIPRNPSEKAYFDGRLEMLPDPFPEYNFGQPVARVGDGAFLLKKQTGMPTGGGTEYWEEDPDGATEKMLLQLEIIAKMPQSAYTRLAKVILLINQRGLHFDSFEGNLLIDEEKGVFNVIDIDQKKIINTLKDMLDAFGLYYVDFLPNQDKKSVAQAFAVKILFKTMEAGRLTGLPLPPSNDIAMNHLFESIGFKGAWPQYHVMIHNRQKIGFGKSRFLIETAL